MQLQYFTYPLESDNDKQKNSHKTPTTLPTPKAKDAAIGNQ